MRMLAHHTILRYYNLLDHFIKRTRGYKRVVKPIKNVKLSVKILIYVEQHLNRSCGPSE